ncbi:hypothetical protein HDU76_004866 [Blyttiomyces sp. JEL0837]|nr:hypothetical protein HDU76_004866 [Blyttiomyces sp. JEL0837]
MSSTFQSARTLVASGLNKSYNRSPSPSPLNRKSVSAYLRNCYSLTPVQVSVQNCNHIRKFQSAGTHRDDSSSTEPITPRQNKVNDGPMTDRPHRNSHDQQRQQPPSIDKSTQKIQQLATKTAAEIAEKARVAIGLVQAAVPSVDAISSSADVNKAGDGLKKVEQVGKKVNDTMAGVEEAAREFLEKGGLDLDQGHPPRSGNMSSSDNRGQPKKTTISGKDKVEKPNQSVPVKDSDLGNDDDIDLPDPTKLVSS